MPVVADSADPVRRDEGPEDAGRPKDEMQGMAVGPAPADWQHRRLQRERLRGLVQVQLAVRSTRR